MDFIRVCNLMTITSKRATGTNIEQQLAMHALNGIMPEVFTDLYEITRRNLHLDKKQILKEIQELIDDFDNDKPTQCEECPLAALCRGENCD